MSVRGETERLMLQKLMIVFGDCGTLLAGMFLLMPRVVLVTMTKTMMVSLHLMSTQLQCLEV